MPFVLLRLIPESNAASLLPHCINQNSHYLLSFLHPSIQGGGHRAQHLDGRSVKEHADILKAPKLPDHDTILLCYSINFALLHKIIFIDIPLS